MRFISLWSRDGSVRAVAAVDDADYECVARYRWHLIDGYATRDLPRPSRGVISLHRQVMRLGYGDPDEVDHENRNKLDCRRENLRIVTRAQNAQNMPAQRGARSRYRGVTWDRKLGRWRAGAMINRKQHHIGCFDDEIEAARAADAFRLERMPFALPDPVLAVAA